MTGRQGAGPFGAELPRSYLYVPGDQPARLAKAAGRGADALIMDLEDSVSPVSKATARATVRRWLADQKGRLGQVWLRINADQAGLDIAETVTRGLAGVVVPKAEPDLLAEVDRLLSYTERSAGLAPGAIGVLPLVETAAGLLSAATLATAPRVVRLGLGEADLAAELGLRPGPAHGEMAALRLQIVIASAAGQLPPPVAPMSPDFRDLAALRESTSALLQLGFRARTAIHPAQIPVINDVFTPSTAELAQARRLVAAFDSAERAGAGVITDEVGRMVDTALVRQARETLARAALASGGTRQASKPQRSDEHDKAAARPQVTVIGSLNLDISVTVPLLPSPGMTVLGSAARFTPGGKGANQAVAAARLGAKVRMVGCVGDDDFGRRLVAALHAERVNTDQVRVATSTPTGLAMIAVDMAGENLITVSPGANHQVNTADASAAEGGDILVISAEIPVPVISAALTMARSKANGASPRCILNLAPVPQDSRSMAMLIGDGEGPDWLVVNESEAAAVLGKPVAGLAAAEQAAAELVATGARHAVVTAGAQGAALAGPADNTLTVPGFSVEAVDTVGAGDTFVGALAAALACGTSAAAAVHAAAAAAATAATRHGAQTAMPRPADILTVTGLTWPAPAGA